MTSKTTVTHSVSKQRRLALSIAVAAVLYLGAAPMVMAQHAPGIDIAAQPAAKAAQQPADCNTPAGKRDAACAHSASMVRAWQPLLARGALRGTSPAIDPTPTADPDPGVIGDPASWRTDEFNADWGLGAIGADYAYARGLTGNGVVLGHFDSGVDLQHPEFAGRGHIALDLSDPDCTHADGRVVLDGMFGGCVYSHGDEPVIDAAIVHVNDGSTYNYMEYGSHGTHVAGTMVASRNGSGMHGVSFGSRLVTAQLFSSGLIEWQQDAEGNWSNHYLGWAPMSYTNQVRDFYVQVAAHGAKAVNVEIWNPVPNGATIDDVQHQYLNEQEYYDAFADGAINNQIITVVALGNDNGNIANIYPGLPAFRPDAEPYWLSVANVQRDGDGYVIASSSSICAFSKNWCISAPGTDITSSVLKNISFNQDIGGNGTWDDPYYLHVPTDPLEHGYADYTGTSMAAPHAIGALGLLFERFPYLTGTQVRDVLLTTATDMGDVGVDEIYGWGLINLKKAIEGPGMLLVDTDVAMNQRAGGAKVWAGEAWDNWTNDISGPGRLTKSGIGWLRLAGNNSFAGATVKQGILELAGSNTLDGDVTVQGGLLDVSGTLDGSALTVASGGSARVNGSVINADTLIASGGLLWGTGTLGNTTVQGTISPGDPAGSIGTLHIDGDYTQAAGSLFDVQLRVPNAIDLLAITGNALLEGGTVRVQRSPGNYMLGQSYRLLSAQGGVAGSFASLDVNQLDTPFLKLALRYAPTAVDLAISRGASFASVGDTANRLAVAGTLDHLPDQHAVVQAAVMLNAAQARNAFDQLSGELHASTHSALAQNSQQLRDVALDRARSGNDPFIVQNTQEHPFSAWVQVSASGGHVGSDGNAARADHDAQTTLVGADYRLDGGWLIGAFGGIGKSDVRVDDRRSKAGIDSRILGVYAGGAWGPIGISGGVVQANHDIDTQRNVAFPGHASQLHAEYAARTQQWFAEANYRLQHGSWGIQPYLQYANVRSTSSTFTELGSAAALSGKVGGNTIGFSTAGVRFNVDLRGDGQAQSWLSVHGGLAYRHATGDLAPAASLVFAGTNVPFQVHGARMSNATLAELGVSARTTANSLLEVGYAGQLGGRNDENRVQARFSLSF